MKKEYVYAGLAVLCWGTVATSSKLLMNTMEAMYALAFSFLAAAVFLFVYNLQKGYLKELKEISAGEAVKMMGIGSLGVLFYNLFLLSGTALLPAQEAFVINDLWPALIIVFSWLILKERMNIGKIIAILFSFLGILIIVTDGDIAGFFADNVKGAAGSRGGVMIRGICYCLAAAVCYGLYSVLNKKEDYNKNISVLLSYVSGAFVSFLYIIIAGEMRMPTLLETGGMAFNGIICNAVPYLLWALALDKGNTAIIANMAYLTPFISLFVTHFVLGERITIWSVAGLLLIVLGLGIQILTQSLAVSGKCQCSSQNGNGK